MHNRKTKIVCSLGPSSREDSVVRDLIQAGMNVARLNFSHGSHEEHRAAIETIRRVSGNLGVPVAILLDTKGPEIRTGMVENNSAVTINRDDAVAVTTDDCLTTPARDKTPARLSISWKDAASKMERGHHILVADGLLDLEVIEVSDGVINCRANNSARIGGKKNVNLIGAHARLPIMNEQDKSDIAFGAEIGVDFIAASFLSFPYEVFEIKKYLESLNASIKIIAKIENGEGLENIMEIAQAADGIMVARGDLGVQLPTEQIPLAQKHIINVCRRVGKPVITATQMLESMIVNPRPTRAELTDVANAILDGTDAVMLSGETAVGSYPIEAVQTMDKIARTVEQSDEFRKRMKGLHSECFSQEVSPGPQDENSEGYNPRENLGTIIARSGVRIASAVRAKAIVTPTLSGNTARLLSVFRPDNPVIAVTPNEKAEREMQLYWGVSAYRAPLVDETEGMIQNAMKITLENKIAEISDKIVLVAGLPLNSPNNVNAVRVLILGTILARSTSGGFANPGITRVSGKIVHSVTPNDARDKIILSGGEILACRVLTSDYIPIIRVLNGVICEEISELTDADLRSINPDLVWLTHISRSAEKLESGLTVTIDANQLLVYEGSI